MSEGRGRPGPRPTRHIVLKPGEDIIEAITRAANEDAAARLDGDYLRWERYRRLRTFFLALLAVVAVLAVLAGSLWRWYGGGWLASVGAGGLIFLGAFFLLGRFLGEKVEALRPGE